MYCMSVCNVYSPERSSVYIGVIQYLIAANSAPHRRPAIFFLSICSSLHGKSSPHKRVCFEYDFSDDIICSLEEASSPLFFHLVSKTLLVSTVSVRACEVPWQRAGLWYYYASDYLSQAVRFSSYYRPTLLLGASIYQQVPARYRLYHSAAPVPSSKSQAEATRSSFIFIFIMRLFGKLSFLHLHITGIQLSSSSWGHRDLINP